MRPTSVSMGVYVRFTTEMGVLVVLVLRDPPVLCPLSVLLGGVLDDTTGSDDVGILEADTGQGKSYRSSQSRSLVYPTGDLM